MQLVCFLLNKFTFIEQVCITEVCAVEVNDTDVDNITIRSNHVAFNNKIAV